MFPDSAELFLGSTLLYYILPTLERRVGSRKLLTDLIGKAVVAHVLVTVSLLWSISQASLALSNVLLGLPLPAVLRNGVAAGPSPIVIMLAIQLFTIHPGEFTLTLGQRVQVSEKSLLATLAALLAFSNPGNYVANAATIVVAAYVRPMPTQNSRASRTTGKKGVKRRFLHRLRIPALLKTFTAHAVDMIHRGLGSDVALPRRSSRAERRNLMVADMRAEDDQGPSLAAATSEQGDNRGRDRRQRLGRSENGGASDPSIANSIPSHLLHFFARRQLPSDSGLSAQVDAVHEAFPGIPRAQVLQAVQER